MASREHPYRTAVRRGAPTTKRTRDPDTLVLCALTVLTGMIPVVPALASRAPWGAAPSLGLLLIALGLAGMRRAGG